MGFVQRQLVKLVIRVVNFPKFTLAICGLLLAGSVALALMKLNLSTDEDELMTPKLAFFRDYKEFTREFPENDAFTILLEPKDDAHPPPAQRWINLADELTAALMSLHQDVTRVDSHVPPDAMGYQGLMFDEMENLRSESRHAADLAQFGRIVGDPGSLESMGTGGLLGQSMVHRVLNALDQSTDVADSAPLAQEVMNTLAAAIRSPRPVDQWQHGAELPSMAQADPRALTEPRVHGYNIIPDESKRGTPAFKTEQLLVITIHVATDFSSLKEVTGPLNRMRAVVDQVAPHYPEFRKPIVTGRAAMQADQMQTSESQTRLAEIFGLTLVFIVLYLFLRNLWMVIVAELCLGAGIGWTFGWATLMVGRLNLLSLVFVIALIGIGMDYLIQILMRYQHENKGHGRPAAIWARVFRYVSPPISTACCGAAAAFFVAMLTNFHGAAELGLIAGGGLLLCLATGYTIMPALLTVFPAAVGRVHESRPHRHPRAGGAEEAGGAGEEGLPGIKAIIWVVLALAGLIWALPPHFDPNLIKLQDETLDSVKQVRKLQAWSAVVTSSDLRKLKAAREAMTRPLPDGESKIRRTESLLDAYDKRDELQRLNSGKIQVSWHDPAPPSAAELKAVAQAAQKLAAKWSRPGPGGKTVDTGGVQAAAKALTAAINDREIPQTDKIRRAGEWQMQFAKQVRTNVEQFVPEPPAVALLPPTLREHLMSEKTPVPVYALYLYPRDDLWDASNLAPFVMELEQRFNAFKQNQPEMASGVVLTGLAPQLYHSTQEIQKAFILSTVYALLAVCVLMLLDLRSITQTLLAISVLALGLPMLLLLMYVWRQWLHEPLGIPGSWNLANFFALPILIGAGHEYGVFMVHRYREALHDPRRVWRTWDVADRALLLCAIVTTCSFGFLTVTGFVIGRNHHGLQSLGWVMAVGTSCVYLSSLLVLRPILLWILTRRRAHRMNAEP